MAKYRHVHVEFWQDPKVLEEMTPEDKYFYLYLLTNPLTTQIGVYKITKKQMAFELGYSMESVTNIMDRFINVHKLIKYNDKTRELAIINWGKYNLNKAGKPVLDCIRKELKDVKDKTLLWEIMNHIPNETVAQEFSRHVYDTCHDTLDDTLTTGGQKEKEKEKTNTGGNPFTFYEQNFSMLTPIIIESITEWSEMLSDELVVEALKIAIKQNVRKFSYAEGILKKWKHNNVSNLNDVQALESEQEKPKGPKKTREQIEHEKMLAEMGVST